MNTLIIPKITEPHTIDPWVAFFNALVRLEDGVLWTEANRLKKNLLLTTYPHWIGTKQIATALANGTPHSFYGNLVRKRASLGYIPNAYFSDGWRFPDFFAQHFWSTSDTYMSVPIEDRHCHSGGPTAFHATVCCLLAKNKHDTREEIEGAKPLIIDLADEIGILQ